MKAYVEAIQYFKTNKQAAFDQIAKSSGIADRQDIAEYYETLTKNFLQDNPVPTLAGMRTVLDQLAARNPRVRELKPENIIDTRFLAGLKGK